MLTGLYGWLVTSLSNVGTIGDEDTFEEDDGEDDEAAASLVLHSKGIKRKIPTETILNLFIAPEL